MEMMTLNWAVYLGWDNMALFQRVVTYVEKSSEIVTIKHFCFDVTYDVPAKDIRKIDAPVYIYGDIVSPTNHPEMLGVISGIGYYFKTHEPCYSISIKGKRKSKRYFKDDLVRIKNDKFYASDIGN